MDRNCFSAKSPALFTMSLSARRAWIEMVSKSALMVLRAVVALRKESVDRNIQDYNIGVGAGKSLSARRAWIEISAWGRRGTVSGSLSARRAWIEI